MSSPKPFNNAALSPARREYLRKTTRRKTLVTAAQLLIAHSFFMLWEAAARAKIIDPFIFSCPSRVFAAFLALIKTKALFVHIGVTLGETALGFTISTALGLVIAIALWYSTFAERVLAPYLVVLNSLPKTALAPIIIVIAGNNPKSVVITAVMTSIIVAVMNMLQGFLAVSPEKIKLVQTLGASRRQTLTKLIIPASVPVIINTIKINIGLSLVGVIVGEFLTAKEGLGYLIVYGSQIFKMDWVMLSVITLAALSALLYQGVVIIERKYLRHFCD